MTGYGGRAPRPLVPRPPSSSRAPLRGHWVGGRAGAHLGPSSQGLLAQARVRRRAGEETRRAGAQCWPDRPPQSVSMGARRQPRAPAPGPRLKVRAQHSGKVGGRRWRKDARAITRQGRGNCGASAILSPSPYLRPRGRVHHPPSRQGGGRAPSWPPPSQPLNSLGDRGYCHRLFPLPLLTAQRCGQWVGKKGDATPSEPPPPLPRPHQNGRHRLGRHHHHNHHCSLSLPPARPVVSRETVTGGWGNEKPRVLLAQGAARCAKQAGRCSPLEAPRWPAFSRASQDALLKLFGAALRLPTPTTVISTHFFKKQIPQ
uniref:uncharacterized protein LOC120887339 n=1 Tax=Ictidomys tridecemlineatus TaxID=43179 RepID=UPI001A9E90C7|nr:uncharacterized protein LOC120887339 [Ictidomys tridecemlineatus]